MMKAYNCRENSHEETAEQPSAPVVSSIAVVNKVSTGVDEDGLLLHIAPQRSNRLSNSEMLKELPLHLSHLSDSQR